MQVSFFIIGVQKGGTTSAAYHLNQHPLIIIPDHEIHFFDQLNYLPDYNLYHNNFLFTNKNTLYGEKTPSYSYLNFAIDRIYNYNPDAKLFMFLREPLSRAYSQWNMAVQTGNVNSDFITSIKAIQHIRLKDIMKNGYYALQRGFYIDQILHIISKFNRENLYIGISEIIKTRPVEEYNRIFSFLGVDPIDNIKFIPDIHKRSYDRNLIPDEFKFLYNIYYPYNQRLYDFLGYEIKEWELSYSIFK
jgi:hypothetical protein